jgi:hypothetical protein
MRRLDSIKEGRVLISRIQFTRDLRFRAVLCLCDCPVPLYDPFAPSVRRPSPSRIAQPIRRPALFVFSVLSSLFDFRKVPFLSVFRLFLTNSQFPGQALIIDRLMELFHTKFFNHNPPCLFSCTDQVYFLSFPTLLFYINPHNPNVMSQMTLEQFLSNNHSQYRSNDPTDFLTHIYRRFTLNTLPIATAWCIGLWQVLDRLRVCNDVGPFANQYRRHLHSRDKSHN